MKNLLGLFVAVLFCLGQLAYGEVCEVQPGPEGQDISYNSSLEHLPSSWEDNELIVAGYDDPDLNYHLLIKFPLQNLPYHADSAVVYLYCSGSNNGLTSQLSIQYNITDWFEGFNDGDTSSDPINYLDSKLPYIHPAPMLGGEYAIDITPLYNKWKSGEIANYGLKILGAGAVYTKTVNYFYSSDYSGDPVLRPKLVVTGESSTLTFIPPLEVWDTAGYYYFGSDWKWNATKKNCDPQYVKGGRPYKHVGQDIGAPVGTSVMASADGRVVIVKKDIGGGWAGGVVIEHDRDGDPSTGNDRLTTLYEHLVPTARLVKGQLVKQGEVIGTIAYLRNSVPHLHFGVREGAYMEDGNDGKYLRGALPPTGAVGCKSTGGAELPEFPESWINPEEIM